MAALQLDRLCVFCGSSSGTRPQYATAAQALGQQLVKRNIGLVYGGMFMQSHINCIEAVCTHVSDSSSLPCHGLQVVQWALWVS